MNRKAVRPIVLSLIFICAMVMFSFLLNKVNTGSTITMKEASLPVMQFVYKGISINELHGYTQEMDELSMRDGMVPMDENRTLNLEILTYGNEIENLSYEIRSIDGTRLLLEEDEADVSATKDKVECNIVLPSLFEANVEYNMELVVTVGGRDVYYYTRIVQSEGCYVDETLEFALKFHSTTFTKEGNSFIPTYLDPATGDATKLSYVDLSCTLKQVMWGNFKGVKLTEPVASFKEITPTYNVIVLNYVVTNVNENNEVEYYNIEEYYRLRQNPQRIYVLNFERTMNQIFRTENDFLAGDSSLLLGIRDGDVEYLADEAGDRIAFVQEGDLWVYDRINNSVAQVFSFRGQEGIDDRENWNQHSIEIVRVDEAGSISFVVYGYMNRGVHEGQVGVGVYYYDAIAKTVEEEVFISSNKSYEVLKAEMGDLRYVNEQKMFYLMLNDNVYKIDLTNYEVSTLIESETSDAYAVSKTGRYLAYVEDEALYSSSEITLIDLKTGIEYVVTSGAGTEKYLLPLAFIGDDFVYGVANASEVGIDSVGNFTFPMCKIEILNTSEEKLDVVKEYIPQKGRIGDVTVDENNVYMELVVEENGRYVYSSSDTIMNRETEPANQVAVKVLNTDVKQKQIALNMKAITSKDDVEVAFAKHILVEENRTIQIQNVTSNYYYAFVRGEVLLATTDVSKAIKVANANYGVVVDSDLKYIFKRARNTSQTALKNLAVNEGDANASSVAKCVSVILAREGFGVSVSDQVASGQTPAYILRNTLTDVTVLELYDCSLDELLYFIDQSTPVYARIGSGQAILLTGYTSNTVYYYDTASRQTKSTDYKTMEEMLYQGGNYFIVYVK